MAKHTSQSSFSSLTATLYADEENTFSIPKLAEPTESDISLDLADQSMFPPVPDVL